MNTSYWRLRSKSIFVIVYKKERDSACLGRRLAFPDVSRRWKESRSTSHAPFRPIVSTRLTADFLKILNRLYWCIRLPTSNKAYLLFFFFFSPAFSQPLRRSPPSSKNIDSDFFLLKRQMFAIFIRIALFMAGVGKPISRSLGWRVKLARKRIQAWSMRSEQFLHPHPSSHFSVCLHDAFVHANQITHRFLTPNFQTAGCFEFWVTCSGWEGGGAEGKGFKWLQTIIQGGEQWP